MLGDEAFVWIGDGLLRAADARIRVDDHGLVVGDGAFETLKIVGGVPFAIERHMRRLHTTLAAMAIPAPDESGLREAMAAVVDANELSSGRLRLTVTGGRGPLGSGEPAGPPTVVVAAERLGTPPNRRIAVAPWTRNERGALTGLKTTSYGENVRALRYAHERGAGEALFANTRGELCEGTGTNVFVVVGDRILTPPLSSGCLAGITRELVLEVADAEEQQLPINVLATADEVFLTSSTRDVAAVEQVDDRVLVPGPVTAGVAAAFAELQAATVDP